MKTYSAQVGQSILDVCLNTYGSYDFLRKLVTDNNLSLTNYRIDTPIQLVYDETLSVNANLGSNQSINTVRFSTAIAPEVVVKGFEVVYGYLYNAAALTNLANVGWRVPTKTDYQDLIAYVGIDSALKLMEVGTTHWTTGIGTNTVGFSMRGSGGITSGEGISQYLKVAAVVRTQTAGFFGKTSFHFMAEGGILDLVSDFRQEDDKSGYSVRLIKESTTLTNGQVGTYIGNDGSEYPTICIGTQEWLSVNLKETKYNNGTDIVKCTNNAADWVALTNAGGVYAAYNNDESLA